MKNIAKHINVYQKHVESYYLIDVEIGDILFICGFINS